ncbi:unnamed protein product [Linum trigynum]|uniref:Uncharacterized protein n=1 Tax=Linum trigynum TaxID=586398 RepID=A0AAV2CG50_9ROSI
MAKLSHHLKKGNQAVGGTPRMEMMMMVTHPAGQQARPPVREWHTPKKEGVNWPGGHPKPVQQQVHHAAGNSYPA